MIRSGAGTAPGMRRQILAGVLAGAAGTTALNALTYLDMAVRGRPSSDIPEQAVDRTASKVGARVPGDDEARGNRLSGLGPLTGIATGVGIGAVYGVAVGLFGRPPLALAGLLVGAGAMAGTDVPMVASGLTDPRSWGVQGWLSDIVPHLGYGYVTAATVELAG
jgi:hypothetical protein